MVGRKQRSGGLRDNSSSLHTFKKERDLICEWCGISFKSVQANAKYSSNAHRLKAWRARKSSKKKKELTPLDRKGKDFRVFRLVKSPPVQDQTPPQ